MQYKTITAEKKIDGNNRYTKLTVKYPPGSLLDVFERDIPYSDKNRVQNYIDYYYDNYKEIKYIGFES